MGDRVQRGQRGLHGVLLTHVEQAQSNGKKVGPGPAQGPFHCLSLNQGLEDCLRNLVVAGGNKDEPQAHGGHCRAFDGARGVHNHRGEILQQVLSAGARVGVTQAHDGGQPEQRVLRLELLTQEGPGRIALLVLNAAGHQAEGKQGTSLQVRVRTPLVLVDLRQALIDAPEQQGSKGTHRAHHAHLLVLVHPLGLVHSHELILAEAGVDEGVDEG
mmetsp:Transcript_31108/g.70742  ORF Transcript_31108/g.70742 Transcript_31108/m.70742 type:complete len:215 (+) Transcript_31108:1112-1756(+)